jgi:hypothetical protein
MARKFLRRNESPAPMWDESSRARSRPVRFEPVVNLKAAKGIGLAIPESFLLRTDDVIEWGFLLRRR